MMEYKKILVGTDKYGTKSYKVLTNCDRCGGSGFMPYWVDGGVCFKCGGSGKVWEQEKEYTPERRAQLDAQNAKRAERKAEKVEAQRQAEYETNKAESLAKNGFSTDGKTYVFLGETYSIKDALKSLGARFCPELGWHIDHPVTGYETIAINLDQVADISDWGRVVFRDDAKAIADKAKKVMLPASKSEWVGTLKERKVLDLVFQRMVSFDTVYGTMHIYTFKQGENVLVWKTSSALWSMEEREKMMGKPVKVKATIKAHTEYRDEKQTELSRLALVA